MEKSIKKEIKTMKDWDAFASLSGNDGSFDTFCDSGDLVDESIVDHFINCLPPLVLENDYVQAGGQYALHKETPGDKKLKGTYATFLRVEKHVWRYCGNCFHYGHCDIEKLQGCASIREYLDVTAWLLEHGFMNCRRPHVVCADGFTVSVQASPYHYCTPRKNLSNGAYSAVELGMPNRKEELLMPYAEESKKPTKTVYPYVPVEIVDEVIKKHGGFYKD